MPDFGSPFSGNDLGRKMTKDELIRALRFAIAAEYEAIQLYRQLANATDEEFVADVMNDVADEEVVHAGEFLEVLKKIHPSEAKFYDEGAKEVREDIMKKRDGSIVRFANELKKIASDLSDDPFGNEKSRNQMEKIDMDKKANSRIASVSQDLIRLAKEIESKDCHAKFPSKALDYNKVSNVDGFWDWSIDDAKRMGSLRFSPNKISDIIFFLNMAASTWEDMGSDSKRRKK